MTLPDIKCYMFWLEMLYDIKLNVVLFINNVSYAAFISESIHMKGQNLY